MLINILYYLFREYLTCWEDEILDSYYKITVKTSCYGQMFGNLISKGGYRAVISPQWYSEVGDLIQWITQILGTVDDVTCVIDTCI